jgi:hypothetical protein
MLRDVSEAALNLLVDHIHMKSYLKRKSKIQKARYFEMAQKGGHLRSYNIK